MGADSVAKQGWRRCYSIPMRNTVLVCAVGVALATTSVLADTRIEYKTTEGTGRPDRVGHCAGQDPDGRRQDDERHHAIRPPG